MQRPYLAPNVNIIHGAEITSVNIRHSVISQDSKLSRHNAKGHMHQKILQDNARCFGPTISTAMVTIVIYTPPVKAPSNTRQSIRAQLC